MMKSCLSCKRFVQKRVLEDGLCPRCGNAKKGKFAAIWKAIDVLREGPSSCSNLGAALWGIGTRNSQSYARPAGRVLHQMKRMGLVEMFYSSFDQRYLWKLSTGWARALKLHLG